MGRMSHFSLKQLLLTITFVALGFGLLALVIAGGYFSMSVAALCGAVIGAGFLTLFKRPWIGALVGLILTPPLSYLYMLWRVYG